MVIASSGNFIQWFDNTLFFVMVPLIIFNFTPKDSGIENTLTVLIIYSSTLLTRPFGAIIFANLSDHFGRRQLLSVTSFAMGASTLFLALCPNEPTIGVAAPAFLLLFTFIHGFSSGGEWPNSSCYLYETTSKGDQAKAGFIAVFQLILGLLVSNLLITLFVEVKDYFFEGVLSWRILFIVSSILAFVASKLRGKLPTPAHWHERQGHAPLLKALYKNRSMLLLSFGVSAVDGVIFNAFIALGYPLASIVENRAFSLIATLIGVISIYFLYRVSKKIGALKTLKVSLFMIGILACIQMGITHTEGYNMLRFVYAIAGILYLIPLPILQPAMFEPLNRSFCVAISRTVSIFVFGGIGMLIFRFTTHQGNFWFSAYVLASCLISYIAVSSLSKKRLNIY